MRVIDFVSENLLIALWGAYASLRVRWSEKTESPVAADNWYDERGFPFE